MIDGRSSYSKVLHLHYLLSQDYDIGAIIHYQDIEDLIEIKLGYSGHRTFTKYFKILERRHLLKPHPRAHKISLRKTATKQKGNKLQFHHYRGDTYCRSHYILQPSPMSYSPSNPLQSSLNERVWNQDGNDVQNICVRIKIEGPTSNTVLDTNIRDIAATSSPVIASVCDVEEKKAEQREERESSSEHTHIILPKSPKSNGVHDYLKLLQQSKAPYKDKSTIRWRGGDSS